MYAVTVGTPGCLPETVTEAETLSAALDRAKQEKQEFLEGGYRVEGNIRQDWLYWVHDPQRISGYRWMCIEIQERVE